jgi:hypothetical protein
MTKQSRLLLLSGPPGAGKGLYGAFENLGELERCVIDSSAMTIEETAAAVHSHSRAATSSSIA